MDTLFNSNCDQKKVGEVFNDEVDDDQEIFGETADDEGHGYQDKVG